MNALVITAIVVFVPGLIVALFMFISMVFTMKYDLSKLKDRFESKVNQNQFYCLEHNVKDIEEKIQLLADYQEVDFTFSEPVKQSRFVLMKNNPTKQ